MKPITGSRSPAMNRAGTRTGACRHAPVSSQLRSMLRYQFSGPVKPASAYCATYASMSCCVSQPGNSPGTEPESRNPPPGGMRVMPGESPEML